jgi:hypothetical protein
LYGTVDTTGLTRRASPPQPGNVRHDPPPPADEGIESHPESKIFTKIFTQHRAIDRFGEPAL